MEATLARRILDHGGKLHAVKEKPSICSLVGPRGCCRAAVSFKGGPTRTSSSTTSRTSWEVALPDRHRHHS